MFMVMGRSFISAGAWGQGHLGEGHKEAECGGSVSGNGSCSFPHFSVIQPLLLGPQPSDLPGAQAGPCHSFSKTFDSPPSLQSALHTPLCDIKDPPCHVPNLRISWSLSVKSTFWSLLQAECLRVPRGAPQFQGLISIHTWHRIQAGRPLKCQDPLRPGPWPPVPMGLGRGCSQRAPMVPESSTKSVLSTEPLLLIVWGEHPLSPTLHQPSHHCSESFPLIIQWGFLNAGLSH